MLLYLYYYLFKILLQLVVAFFFPFCVFAMFVLLLFPKLARNEFADCCVFPEQGDCF